MVDKKIIEKKISSLKNRLIQIQRHYHLKIYLVFLQIYNSRKKLNKKYSIVDLSNESTIKDMFEYHYVATIMEIGKITKKTEKLIDTGVFTYFEVANTLRRSKILQSPNEQDRFFGSIKDKVINGKMTKKEFREKVTVFNNGLKKNMSEEQSWLLQTVYEIRAVKKYIIERFNKLAAIHQIKIKKEVEELSNFVSKKQNKEYSLVWINKNTLKKLRALKITGISGNNDSKMFDRLVEYHLTGDMVKCANCKKPFKKNRKDQICCTEKCKKQKNYRIRQNGTN